MKPMVCVLSAFLLLVPTCAASPTVRGISELGSVLRSEVPKLMQAADVPGLAIALIEDGRPTWHGAFGDKNAETGEAVTLDTVFEAASLSKPVFAYAVLRMAKRGELDLGAPLWKTLPYERLEHDPRARRIDARLVLSHQAGLPNWGGTPLEMSLAPGERWSYSGEGYVYLQKTIEKRTGLELDAFVRREVFEPLGMEHSSYVWREAYSEAAASPHDHLGKVRPKRQPDANAAASLHTTMGDYARFVAAMFAEEQRKLSRLMLKPRAQVRKWGSSEVADGLDWGLGWGLQKAASGRAFWHWGDNGNFRCFVMGRPSSGDAMVYFTNSENGLALVGDLLARVFPQDEHVVVSWMGFEQHDDPRRRIALRLERAFLDDGAEAGLKLYEKLSEAQPEVVDGPLAERVARALLVRRRRDDAIALLEANVVRFPKSVPALHGLGQATLDAGRLERALAVYRKILELAPQDERAPVRIAWAQFALEARKHPVEVREATLRRYAGSYGPRQVTLEDGRLRYVRRGNDVHYWLTPMSEDTFALDELPYFRLRFVSDGDGRVVKVEGLYSDGRADESMRDPD